MNKLNIDNLIMSLSILFIFFIDFRVFKLETFSLADPIFIFLLISIAIRGKINVASVIKGNSKIILLFIVFITLWIVSFMSPMLSYENQISFLNSNLIMIFGSIYLVAVSITFFHIAVVFGYTFVLKAILYSGLVNAIVALLGLLLFTLDIESNLVSTINTSSPYLANFPRLTGFSITPNGLAYSFFTALIISIPLYYSEKISKRFVLASSLIIFIALLFTLAKILLIFFLASTTWFINRLFNNQAIKLKKYLLSFILLSGFFLYMLSTHILFIDRDKDIDCKYGSEIIINKFDNRNIQLCPSIFLTLKVLYTKLGFEKLPWGVGSINDLNISKPHSTYLERFTLHGIIGICSLIVLVYTLYNTLKGIKDSNASYNNLYYVLYLFWLMNIYIALNTDLLRYREFWLMIGITIAIKANYPKKIKNNVYSESNEISSL